MTLIAIKQIVMKKQLLLKLFFLRDEEIYEIPKRTGYYRICYYIPSVFDSSLGAFFSIYLLL